MNLAPIVLFTYNRPEHTKKTIEALKRNLLSKHSELFVFSDNHKQNATIEEVRLVNQVREYIRTIDGFKSIHISEALNNNGLANSVINGVTKVINQYGKVIVLEDDLIISEFFLNYMNECLEVFAENKNIWSISGYTPPIKFKNYNEDLYIVKRGCSWGWGTWKDRWESIYWEDEFYNNLLNNKKLKKQFNNTGYDMTYMLELQKEGKIDSWAIRWCYNQFVQSKYTVYPRRSFVRNIGTDNSGTHSSNSERFNVDMIQHNDIIINKHIEYDSKTVKSFRKFYSPIIKIVISKYARKIGAYQFLRRKIYK